jgi:hypothetical protein
MAKNFLHIGKYSIWIWRRINAPLLLHRTLFKYQLNQFYWQYHSSHLYLTYLQSAHLYSPKNLVLMFNYNNVFLSPLFWSAFVRHLNIWKYYVFLGIYSYIIKQYLLYPWRHSCFEVFLIWQCSNSSFLWISVRMV